MKSFCSIVALCLVFSCASLSQAGRLERVLLQQSPPAEAIVSIDTRCTTINGRCYANARVTTQAINDAAASLAETLASAIATVDGGGDVQATASSFAVAIARAYARIISTHVISVGVVGVGDACAYTFSQGLAYANSIATASSRAFASVENEFASASAQCVSDAVRTAAVTATQTAFAGTCVGSFDREFIFQRFETVGLAQAIAVTVTNVFAAIRNGVPRTGSYCAP